MNSAVFWEHACIWTGKQTQGGGEEWLTLHSPLILFRRSLWRVETQSAHLKLLVLFLQETFSSDYQIISRGKAQKGLQVKFLILYTLWNPVRGKGNIEPGVRTIFLFTMATVCHVSSCTHKDMVTVIQSGEICEAPFWIVFWASVCMCVCSTHTGPWSILSTTANQKGCKRKESRVWGDLFQI